MKHIALIAACDRYNYGDVLMPILFEKYYNMHGKQNAEFDYFALSRADLRDVGGKTTNPITEVGNEYEIVIIAGGEVLTATYRGMWQNLQTSELAVKIMRQIARLSPQMAENFSRKLLGGKTILPWSYFPKSKGQMVFYNSVGGQKIKNLNSDAKNELNELLKYSTTFSVRDAKTLDDIGELPQSSHAHLMPDTAITMSRLYSIQDLTYLSTGIIRKMVECSAPYFVVQVSKDFGDGVYKDVALAINKIYGLYGIRAVLLPIGRVQGHEDDVPLKKIQSLCDKGACTYIEKDNIYDIMLLISNGIAFIGTSLHGVITAASYFVPHAVVNPKCSKTRNFINTWKTSTVDALDGADEIFNFVIRNDIKATINVENIIVMQDTVLKHYKMITDEIDKGV